MTTPNLEQNVSAAQTALRSFLNTLIGQEALLRLHPPTEAPAAEIQEDAAPLLVIHTGNSAPFAACLDPAWLPLLSEPMLGEAVAVGEPGYDDLARELAGQAFGAVRTQLGGQGVTLPEVTFTVEMPGTGVPPGLLQNEGLRQLRFDMKINDQLLTGFAVIVVPAVPPAFEMPAGMTDAPATMSMGAPGMGAPGMGAPGMGAPGMGAPGMGAPGMGARTMGGMGGGPAVPVAPVAFPDLGPESYSGGDGGHPFGLLADVELEVTVELGRRRLPLSDILRLTTGSVIELEKLVGEPLEVYANGRLIAEGEAVVIDEQFGIRITSLATQRARQKAYR